MKSEAMVLENLNIPSNKALFMGFMKLGLMGFGGVLPLAHRLIVEDQKWLNTEQFTNLLGICQILPGGNIINVAAAIGYEFHGVKGAFCSVLGLIFAPTAIVILIYELYAQFQNIPSVKHMIEGLAAAAAGLLFATGLKMAKPIIKSYMTMTSIVLAFVFMIIFKIPLLLTLLILLAMNMLILGVKKS
ncbi:chromate transporter [Acinetobacter gerneri]|uniref:chromate transporter n=1 Tax=Acinetobacter gerneri TaxID=202952 RepID=UPI0032142FCC